MWSKNSDIVKYKCNLKYIFFIYSNVLKLKIENGKVAKLISSCHYSIFQCHMILQKS